MKTNDNKEMDLLLRALARNKPANPSGSDDGRWERPLGSHLDADELNCYAEGVATDAERARYVKHLADCSSCRHQVANLVPVASVMRREPLEQKSSLSFRNRLAALLSPAALRYALPALLLTSILAIAIIALRQPKQADFVAQRAAAPTPDLSVRRQPESVTSQQSPQPAAPAAGAVASPVNPKEKNAPVAAAARDIQPAAVGGVETGEAKEESRTDKTSAAQSQPALAKPMEAAAPPPPRVSSDEARKVAEVKQQEEANLDKRQREDTNAQTRDANEAERVSGPRKGPSRGSGAQNIGALSSSISRAKDDEKALGRTGETRTVAGRIFYRQVNAWIDTDYASGRATVSMKRGSEQFRALIADEPGLRSIAEQLSGEVFVVWKGTAYRIH